MSHILLYLRLLDQVGQFFKQASGKSKGSIVSFFIQINMDSFVIKNSSLEANFDLILKMPWGRKWEWMKMDSREYLILGLPLSNPLNMVYLHPPLIYPEGLKAFLSIRFIFQLNNKPCAGTTWKLSAPRIYIWVFCWALSSTFLDHKILFFSLWLKSFEPSFHPKSTL